MENKELLMENYAYIRVSTDKQNTENQRFEINSFCAKYNIKIHKWIKETISGAKQPEDRKLGRILTTMKKGDTLICTELSRLGRDLFMINSILNDCMKREIKIWTTKEQYRLGSDISCKVLAFAFGISAEIERKLNQQRTRETMARLKAEGIKLGRPLGSKSRIKKLTGKEEIIAQMRKEKMTFKQMAKKLKVNEKTIRNFVSENIFFNNNKKKLAQ